MTTAINSSDASKSTLFEYQQWNRYFAQVAGTIEGMAAEELEELGAGSVRPSYKGVYFEADKSTLYRINYQSRLASRILAPLLTFKCHSTRYLYRTARSIPWSAIMSPDITFAISATVAHSRIGHSKYAALCLKDAIADYFRDTKGKRPDVRTKDPDLRFHLHIEKDRAIVSLDTSGGPLHRRGYRQETVEAPMRETLAAAIIRLTEWEGVGPLWDPMCGSGTLLSEALMHACRIPAGFLRKRFGFEFLPDFDRDLWTEAKAGIDGRIRTLKDHILFGSDISGTAVNRARENCRLLPFGESITWKVGPMENIHFPSGCTIVCNPPYGVRLGSKSDAAALYRRMGSVLKQKCGGSIAFIYAGDPALLKELGMKPSMKRSMLNGAIAGKLCRFEIFPPKEGPRSGEPLP